jgi:hypothetical protein
MGDPQTTRKPTTMTAFSPNSAPLHDPWLNPPDDEPWCDNCDHPVNDCTCDDDELEEGE